MSWLPGEWYPLDKLSAWPGFPASGIPLTDSVCMSGLLASGVPSIHAWPSREPTVPHGRVYFNPSRHTGFRMSGIPASQPCVMDGCMSLRRVTPVFRMATSVFARAPLRLLFPLLGATAHSSGTRVVDVVK